MRNAITIFVLLVAGCASAGTKVNPETVAGFVKGERLSEAEQALGEPNATSTGPDGTTSIVYTYAHSAIRASTFIPIVGGFVGGADTRSQTVLLRFDTAGLYQGATSTTGSIGVGTNLGAQ